MKLKLIKALWGMNGSLQDKFKKISQAGYEGIEGPLPTEEEAPLFQELLKKYQFDYIAQVYTQEDHIVSFSEQVDRARSFNPMIIVSHSAKDHMPYEEQLKFFEHAITVEKSLGVPVAHETHRGRAMFTPWNTSRLLNELKELKLTADFSHWCCVCESLLEDQGDHLEIAMKRTIHIHGRVGYRGGPQVPHPGAPEYQVELNTHKNWWIKICELKKEEGAEFITFTPEFGPPPGYMHTLPYTNQPVTDLWEVCLWMGKKFNEHYNG